MDKSLYKISVWTCPVDDTCDDNIHVGDSFAALEDASAAFEDIDTAFHWVAGKWTRAELHGPNGLIEVQYSKNWRELEIEWRDEEWRAEAYYASMVRAERGMLSGMEGGCDAYNDCMGWGE